MYAAGAAVIRVRDKEGARRALSPASRVVRHAGRDLACKPIEGAHGQRPPLAWPRMVFCVVKQISSAGRRMLVEGLRQQVHILLLEHDGADLAIPQHRIAFVDPRCLCGVAQVNCAP